MKWTFAGYGVRMTRDSPSQADAPPSTDMGAERSETGPGTPCPDCMGTGSREGMDCITCGGTGVAPDESVGGG